MGIPTVLAKVELSTNTPFATPTWQDISAYVPSVTFARGRSDVFSRVTAADCTFTVTNLDGRFTSTNASGAYYPNLRKNNRIRITLQYSSNNSTVTTSSVRFIGFVNEWPNKFEGKDAKAEVTCSDLFKILERFGNSRGNYLEEALGDKPVCLYPLDEGDPTRTFNCVQQTSTPVSSPLTIVRMAGRGKGGTTDTVSLSLQDSNGAPDSAGGVRFNPWGGSLHAGSIMLQGTLPSALPTDWVVEFWMYAETMWFDPENATQDFEAMLTFNANPRLTSQLIIGVDATTNLGNLIIAQDKGSTGAFTNIRVPIGGNKAHILDSKLHMITLEYTSATHSLTAYVDGVSVLTTTSFTFPTGMQFMTVGGTDDRSIYTGTNFTNVNAIRVFDGTLSNIAIFNRLGGSYGTPASRYLAGQGWKGENVQARIQRLLGLCGLTSSQYNIASGTSMVGPQFTKDKSLLDCALDAAAVEDMPLWVDQTGVVKFESRANRNPFVSAMSISAVEFEDVSFADDDKFIVNSVEIAGTNIGKMTLENFDGGTSITNYGKYTKTFNDLPFFSDSQQLNMARRYLTRYSDPKPRVNALVLENASVLGSTLYNQLLALEPNDGVTVTALDTTYPNNHFPSSYQVYIEGVEEEIGINYHKMTFNCTGTTAFDANDSNSGDMNVWQLGVSGHNALGTQTITDF
jgi:hypothetical protein